MFTSIALRPVKALELNEYSSAGRLRAVEFSDLNFSISLDAALQFNLLLL